MIAELKAHIIGKLHVLNRQHQDAYKCYTKTKDESWAARVAELRGRIDELGTIQSMIAKYE